MEIAGPVFGEKEEEDLPRDQAQKRYAHDILLGEIFLQDEWFVPRAALVPAFFCHDHRRSIVLIAAEPAPGQQQGSTVKFNDIGLAVARIARRSGADHQAEGIVRNIPDFPAETWNSP